MMKQTLLRTSFIASLSFFAVNLLVACPAKNGNSPVAPAVHPQPPPTKNRPPISTEGTTDSGGGNGVMEKVYESYAKNPYLLPAYNLHLKNLFDNLEKALPGAGFKAWLLAKTWFIAPVELKKIDKQVLGLSFIDTETGQYALQKLNSVWIKKAIYDGMDSNAQADLILHEYVMIMYLMKFKPYSVICKMINSKNCQNLESIDKLWAPEPLRALNEKDYDNIRSVTAWLKDRRDNDSLNAEDLKAVLIAKAFDERFLNPLVARNEKPITLSKAEFYKIIQAPILTGNPLSHCTAEGSSESTCKVQITENDLHPIHFPTTSIKVFNIDIKNSNGEKKALNFTLGNEVQVKYTLTYKGHDYWVAFGIQMENTFKTGDPANTLVFIFTHSTIIQESPFELKRIYIKPGVITSIDLKRESHECLIQKVKPTSFETQSLILHNENDTDFWEQYLYQTMVPSAACSSINVISE